MKTYSLKANDIQRQWYVIDAKDKPLGRLSTKAAQLLIGKHKPTFSPQVDNGDFVVVINSDQVILTGKKGDEFYFRHTGYPGGIKAEKKSLAISKNSDKVVTNSIKGMLPKNRLQSARLKRLKVYKTTEHQHQAQKPKSMEI